MSQFDKQEACDGCGNLTKIRDFCIDGTRQKEDGHNYRLCPTCYEARKIELMQENPRMISVDLNSDTFQIGKSKKRYQMPRGH